MTITITTNESGPLKRQIIDTAYGQCGILGDVTVEEVAAGLDLLEMMMREHPWSGLGYAHAGYGVGNPDEHANIPFGALSAVSLALAARIAPTKGVVLSREQQAEMSRSRHLLASEYAVIPATRLAPGSIRGAGARGSSPFIYERE